jgi:hypothetical protein
VVDTTEPGEVCVLCVDLDVSERQLLASHGNVGLFWGEGAGFYGESERCAGILNRWWDLGIWIRWVNPFNLS